MTNPDEVKDKFYDDSDNDISATPRTDKLILLGDFNARVGTDHQTWEGVIGSEGVGKCNSNGLLLLYLYLYLYCITPSRGLRASKEMC